MAQTELEGRRAYCFKSISEIGLEQLDVSLK